VQHNAQLGKLKPSTHFIMMFGVTEQSVSYDEWYFDLAE